MIYDLFAGPGGADEGLRMIGRTDVLGIEWDRPACDTALAAGHARLWADIAALDPAGVAEAYGQPEGIWASSPCTLFSPAGKGTGRRVLDILTAGIVRTFAGEDPRAEVRAAVYPIALAERERENAKRKPDKRWTQTRIEDAARADAFSASLVLEPARWITALTPEWVALEQVPAVLPLWQVYARELRKIGYAAWAVVLNAADYGVPQTRERACLGASRVRAVQPPEPTHAQHPHGGDLFGGDGRLRWVSMAQALGWTGGLEVNTRGDRKTPGGNEFSADRPSWALTEKTRSWSVRTHQNTSTTGDRYERDTESPSPTVMEGTRFWSFVSAGVTGEGRPKDPATQPADTLTGKGRAYWVLRGSNAAHAAVRADSEPAPTMLFAAASNDVRWYPVGHTTPGIPESAATRSADSVRVTVQEAGILQSFRPDYPWQGTRSKQFQQAGNAVPPLLAAHVGAAITGAAMPEDVAA